MKTRARPLPAIGRLTGLLKSAAQFLVTITVVVQGWNLAAAAEHGSDGLPDLDRRIQRLQTGNRAPAALRPERLAAENLLRARLPELQLDRHEITGSPKWVSARDGFLTGKSGASRGANANPGGAGGVRADDPHRITKSFVNEHAAVFGHDATALDRATVRRDAVSRHNGTTSTVWEQRHEDIRVFDAVFIANVTKGGELINLSSQFATDPPAAARAGMPNRAEGAAPAISASRALALAGAHLGEEAPDEGALTPAAAPEGAGRKQKFRAPWLRGEARAELVWLPLDERTLRLCWEVSLKGRAHPEVYRVVLDAESGEVWDRHCLTVYISNATYSVFTGDSPTPLSPGYSAPGNTGQPASVGRTLVTTAALNTTASPNGWINDGVNETRGNNADAATDLTGDDSPEANPQGSPNRVFNFPLSLSGSPTDSNYRKAAAVNLFYWGNWMHDKLWELGFDEPWGNYQNDNFGRGGAGNDAVRLDAQDGGGVKNANFNTTAYGDGNSSWIQMYIFPDPNPDRDGDFDNQIIIHEYCHGLSLRLVGGGVGLTKSQSKGMGEGWGDFFALALLSQSGDSANGCYAKGAYATKGFEFDGRVFAAAADNYYFGIRRYPYSTDLSKNPLTFKDIDPAQDSSHAGVPVSPLFGGTSASEVHNQGEVWCSMLWEARAKLIQKHGFATGNQLILQLVVDGMKLSPPNPNFVQARDAILQADQDDNGGANLKELWAGFAKRGLGFNATSPGSSTTGGVQEDFSPPDTLLVTPATGVTVTGPLGGPFPSTSRTYQLNNSTSSSVGWNAFAESPMTVSLGSGTLAASGTVNVTASLNLSGANALPVGTHAREVTFSNRVTHVVQTRVFTITVVNGLEVTPPVADSFEGPAAGEFVPEYLTVQLSNLKSVSMPWSATVAPPLRALPSSGTLAPGETKNVLVLVFTYDTPGMGIGTFPAPVSFSNHLDHSEQTVDFEVTVKNNWIFYYSSGTSSAVGPVGGPLIPASENISFLSACNLSIPWTAVAQAPLKVSQNSGVLENNGDEETLTVTMNTAQASFLPQGTYSRTVILSNHLTGVTRTNTYTLRIGEGDTFSEEFDGLNDFDLAFTTLTWTPDGSGNYYRLCRDAATDLPTPLGGGTTVTGFSRTLVSLTDGKKINFYGQQFSQITIDRTHGYLFFGDYSFSHEDRLGITPLSGTYYEDEVVVYRKQLADRFVVSWVALTDDPQVGADTAQVELFFDGRVRVTYLGATISYATLGLSRGLGETRSTDLSAYPDCDNLYPVPKEPLKVTLPASAPEGAGALGNVGIVSLPFPVQQFVTVGLKTATNSGVTIPSAVTFFPGQTNRTFSITVLNDSLLQGPRIAVITATNSDFYNGSAQMTIHDDETTVLSVKLPPSAVEGGSNVIGAVFSAKPPVIPVKVFLYSTRPDQLLPVSVLTVIPAGQTQAVFQIKAVNDLLLDGPQSCGIVANVTNWTPGTNYMLALDNESTNLTVSLALLAIEGSGTLTNGGSVLTSGPLLTNLTVFLSSSDTTEVIVPSSVVIPAGTNRARFNLDVVDDAIQDGVIIPIITASAPSFGSGNAGLFILDNDGPPEVFNPYPPDEAINVSILANLSWGRIEGELLVNGSFETGDLSGWTMTDTGGGGFVANNGTFDPISPDGPMPPLAGNFSALSHPLGNGTHVLYQDVFIPDAATSVMLRWNDRIRNHAAAFGTNQQFRVELRETDNRVLAVLFRTEPGATNFSDWTARSYDLGDYRGQTLRIAFIEQDALGFLNVHLDNISVMATSANPTVFDVYFGTSPTPDADEYLGSTGGTTWNLPQLAGGEDYYWKIVARRGGATNEGPVWHFRTIGQSAFSSASALSSTWRYVATGVDLGTAWRSPTYVDSIWPSGTAPFGFGSSQTTTIGVASNDFTTFYFRRRVTINDTNRLAGAVGYIKRDDGAIVYVNGIEVIRDNMPSGRVDYLTQASLIVNGSDETNLTSFAIDPTPFVEGVNVIAVEVHQRRNGLPFPGPSTDLFFDFALLTRTNAGNLAPESVTWQQPPNFALVRNPTNLLLQASVADDNYLGTKVEFFADGEKLGEDPITPFFLTWTNPPLGQHLLLAVTTDSGGYSATSAPLHVIVAPAVGSTLVSLVSAGSTWRYLDGGIYPGTNWMAIDYKEPRTLRWHSGPAQLGYGDGDEATVVDYGSDPLDKHITTWFRQTFDNSLGLGSATLRVLRDDGVVVYVNGAEVFRNNLPVGTIRSNTLASTSITGVAESTWITTNIGRVLQSGMNVIAAEVHQVAANNVDLSFDLELVGTINPRPTVALISPATFAYFFQPSSIPLVAVASDGYGQISRVDFFADGVLIGTDASPPYEFNWPNPAPGNHTLLARATDSGNSAVNSAPVQITVLTSVQLGVERSLHQAMLFWPETAPGYHLEAATNLTPPISWQIVTNAVLQTNGQFRVLVVPVEAERYFRLRAP